MAYIECKLRSEILQRKVAVQLYLPTDLPAEVGNETKGVLTLLHGYTQSGDDWLQMTAAARYAADNGLALVCPACQNSFYLDTVFEECWAGFLSQELPQMLRRMFHLPAAREQNWIAGLSMGGYGALYLGLSHPEMYAGCASFSGCVDLAYMLREGDEEFLRPAFAPIFGASMQLPQKCELRYLAKQISLLPAEQQPKILMTNGRQDTPIYHIKEQNDALYTDISGLPLAHLRRMEWDGVHEWNFWDRSLVYAIDYFLQNDYAARKLNDWRLEPTVF